MSTWAVKWWWITEDIQCQIHHKDFSYKFSPQFEVGLQSLWERYTDPASTMVSSWVNDTSRTCSLLDLFTVSNLIKLIMRHSWTVQSPVYQITCLGWEINGERFWDLWCLMRKLGYTCFCGAGFGDISVWFAVCFIVVSGFTVLFSINNT